MHDQSQSTLASSERQKLKKSRVMSAMAITVIMAALTACNQNTEAEEPIDKKGWTVPAVLTDCSGDKVNPAGCIGPGSDGTYTSLSREDVTKPWSLCSTLPHLKDPTWIGMNYGEVDQARRLNVNLRVSDAGGYENLTKQITQIEDCVASGADAILLSAVSNESLNPAIKSAVDAGVVVIDVGNGVSSDQVQARAVQDYFDIGRLAGEKILESKKPLKVALLPGPAGASWAERSRLGFEHAIANSEVEVVDVKFGDTGKEVQLALVEDTLAANPDIDLIVGTAVSVEVAANVLAERGLSDKISLYSTYLVPSTLDLIKAGRVACSPAEQGVVTARMAVDMAVRTLEEKPLEGSVQRVAPLPIVVCGPGSTGESNVETFDTTTTFSPSDWSPVSSVTATKD